tara:strand:+ start:31 stop:504 length:474 start_codon:yes stop_codon:yes gene_type:complete
MATQYVATDKDNVAKDPQPGDVEITDAFGNVFDNQNEYGVGEGLVAFYNEENVLENPQPAYQNLGYVQYTFENVPVSPPWEPDAAQWIPRNVENQVRTPEKYVKSPYEPLVASTSSTLTVTLRVEESEALIVNEADTKGIQLEVVHTQYPSIANFSE